MMSNELTIRFQKIQASLQEGGRGHFIPSATELELWEKLLNSTSLSKTELKELSAVLSYCQKSLVHFAFKIGEILSAKVSQKYIPEEEEEIIFLLEQAFFTHAISPAIRNGDSLKQETLEIYLKLLRVENVSIINFSLLKIQSMPQSYQRKIASHYKLNSPKQKFWNCFFSKNWRQTQKQIQTWLKALS